MIPSTGNPASRAHRSWWVLILWPFPNLRTWAAFAAGIVVGELFLVLAVALAWVAIRL